MKRPGSSREVRGRIPALAGALACLALAAAAGAATDTMPSRPPNVIVLFADDLGYADLGCTGSPDIRTPSLDRMAAQGRRLTTFYVAASLCTPSRVALLTGCYPKRVSMHRGVLFPDDVTGLHPEEETLAEVLRRAGYATGLVGKWHVGHLPPLLPTAQGFDLFFGTPYSSGMPASRHIPLAATVLLRNGLTRNDYLGSREAGVLMRGTEIVEYPVGPGEFTARFTREAIAFLADHRAAPFLLYLPHVMPHIPLGASERFAGRSWNGPYGDAVEELDWSTGRILDTLRELDLDEDSVVLFTSDNGPLRPPLRNDPAKTLGGSAGELRGWKGTTWEGGVRMPCIVWAPGRIAPGPPCDALITTMDLLPTFAGLAGAPLPERTIDGRDVWPLLRGDVEDESPPTLLYYASNGVLEGIRRGHWKLLIHDRNALEKSFPRERTDQVDAVPRIELFDLAEDVGESSNRADERPDLVVSLRETMERLDAEIEAHRRPAWSPGPPEGR